MNNEYKSFKTFYPFYLSEHMNSICGGLHFIGAFCVIIIIIGSFFKPMIIFFAPLCGCGFAWICHFFFGKNHSPTFTCQLYGFVGDRVMFKDILIGQESKINLENHTEE